MNIKRSITALKHIDRALILSVLICPIHAMAADVSEESDELIIEDSPDAEELVIEVGSPGEGGGPSEGSGIVIETDQDIGLDSEDELIIETPDSGALVVGETKVPEKQKQVAPSLKIDEVWADYAVIPDHNSRASGQLYVHAQATANWRPTVNWEFQLSGRLDGYEQVGGEQLDDGRLDYDESFIRYRNDRLRFTVGAQKVIWGRIDEAPPTDRMSTPDFSRYILDDLEDRRRANPALRLEAYFGSGKLDIVYLPKFRAAELPDTSSIWYPVDRVNGQILGLKATPALSALIQASPVDDDAPNGDGGFGVRYIQQSGGLDYAVTAQKVRQAVPYYAYNAVRGVLETKHPRSWVLGGDLGFEAAGATWRFEAAWSSDTPVTHAVNGYDTVESISWGGGVEFFPGDGDARLTLQLTGTNLIGANRILDRREIYLFNGSFETPFASNQWRAQARFYIGLDERDTYFNPAIVYTGWDAQEVYLEGHFFDGADGTPGSFHQDDSLISVGWRARF